MEKLREVPVNIDNPVALRQWLMELHKIVRGMQELDPIREVTNLKVTALPGANLVEFTKSNAEEYILFISSTASIADAIAIPIGRENRYYDPIGKGSVVKWYWVQPTSQSRTPGAIVGPVTATTIESNVFITQLRSEQGQAWNSSSTAFVNWANFGDVNYTKREGTTLLVLANYGMFSTVAAGQWLSRIHVGANNGATRQIFSNEIASHKYFTLMQSFVGLVAGTYGIAIQVAKQSAAADVMNTDANDSVDLVVLEIQGSGVTLPAPVPPSDTTTKSDITGDKTYVDRPLRSGGRGGVQL